MTSTHDEFEGRTNRRLAGTPRRCRKMFVALSDCLDREFDPTMCAKLEAHMEVAAQIRKKLLRAFEASAQV
jgi:hypothetical protein